jgi:hypothetical protein
MFRMPRISRLSWIIFWLSVVSALVLTWRVDPSTPAGVARLIATALAVTVAVLTLLNGGRVGERISAIEAGRYPRPRPGASVRIANAIRNETAQTVTIAGEGGDDIREVAEVLREALLTATWHIKEMQLGAALWDSGRGIMIYHTNAAGPASAALVEGLKAEGLPVEDAGDCTTGNPVHIAFRRP